MPTTPPFGRYTGIKLNPDQIPAFTAEDMMAYLQSMPSCSLGPTLSGEPPTVESIEFVGCKEMTGRLNVWIGLADDALVCYVVLRGPFRMTMMSRAPGDRREPPPLRDSRRNLRCEYRSLARGSRRFIQAVARCLGG